jgi:hypothetical protein
LKYLYPIRLFLSIQSKKFLVTIVEIMD